MCGFIGVYGSDNVASQVYDALVAVQHRGQDAAGIVTWDDRFHLRKDGGLVRDVFRAEDMARLTGPMALGHVRYPTVGSGGVEDAQPFLISAPFGIAMVHNGNVTNYHSLRRELIEEDGRLVNSECDVEVLLHVFAIELEKATSGGELTPDAVFTAVRGVFDRVHGSYSAVALIAGRGLVGFRDPHGIKPIIAGKRTDESGRTAWCVASESVALDLNDYHDMQDLSNGEVLFIDAEREAHRRVVAEAEHRPCIFEHVYFARPDSFLDKVSVYKSRLRMGEELAEEVRKAGIQVDTVIPVPDSSRPAAMRLAQALGVPCREGLVKNRYIGRTFIMPQQDSRTRSVRHKLNAIKLEFEGKNVLIVDDSIVRGTTGRKIVQMARDAGAKSVHFASCAPPLRHPCIYGIDMATKDEFIARDMPVEEIADALGADSVIYQTMEGLTRAVQEGNPEIKGFCNACFTGDYPTELDEATFEAWKKDRTRNGVEV